MDIQQPPRWPWLNSRFGGIFTIFFSLFLFIGFPVACFNFRTWFKTIGDAGWATYSFWSGTGFLLAFVLTSAGFKQVPVFVDMADLWQRICLLTGFAWLSAVAVYFMRNEPGVG